MRNWIEPPQVNVPPELQAIINGYPLVGQILARRGISTPQAARAFLDPACYTPTPPSELPGVGSAADRLERAIQNKDKILVWGDFDVDGQTATTLLVAALRDLNARVDFHIPIRQVESHGVSLSALKTMLSKGAHVLLTCDTGVSSGEAIAYAASQGVDTIITDHHELPTQLPAALVIVSPKLLPQGHPLSPLSGVGIAYKLAEELYRRIDPNKTASQHHDLVALGTVADLALQVGENRHLIQQGILQLRQTSRLGLKILMETANLNPIWLTEEHIGFVLAPRLNSLGRLSNANSMVELLTTSDQGRARVLAIELEGMNARRQLLTNQVFQGAQAQIERDPSLLDSPVLVLSHPTWPAGVIGIVASRLVERYRRPVLLISSPPGEVARGSARSIEGCNITKAIAAQGNMLENFGGHPMAAGLGILPERILEFRAALTATVKEMIAGLVLEDALQLDGYLSLSDITPELAQDLEMLSPFGPGNPPLVLASKDLSMNSHTIIGRNGEHLQIVVEDPQGNSRKILWWHGAGWELPQGRFDLAYTVRTTNYRGIQELQVEWVDARPIEEKPLTLKTLTPLIEIVDCREQLDPLSRLKELQQNPGVAIWREGQDAHDIPGQSRHELVPSQTLAIWTIPPGPREIQEALERTLPSVVYLFASTPQAGDIESFLTRLAGLAKYAVHKKGGGVSLSDLAASTAQCKVTVRKGLEWLAARGYITLLPTEEADNFLLREAGTGALTTQPADITHLFRQINSLLEETAAYREYFRKADKLSLLGIE